MVWKFLCILLICCFIVFLLNTYIISFIKLKRKSIEEWYQDIKTRDNYCPINDISPVLLATIIILEDSNFFSHKGYDIHKLYEALCFDIKVRAKEVGGSSITQQLAKNMYFSFKKTFTRKFAEIFISLQLEKKLTKEEILEMYLNIIDFGEQKFNVKDACDHYFHKSPSAISINEAITLACLLPNPKQYQPLNKYGYFSQARHKALVLLHEKDFFRACDYSWIEESTYDAVLTGKRAFLYQEIYRILYLDMITNRKLPQFNIDSKEISHLFDLDNTSESFVKHLMKCKDEKTKYVFGGLMEEIENNKIMDLARLYPTFYTKQKIEELLKYEGDYGCDCSGLIKSFFFDYNRKYYHPFLDRNSYMMLDIARFKGPVDALPEIAGICLEMPGHVGVYLGKGKVIEATLNEKYGDGIMITNLNEREWHSWFSCYFIYYKELDNYESI